MVDDDGQGYEVVPGQEMTLPSFHSSRAICSLSFFFSLFFLFLRLLATASRAVFALLMLLIVGPPTRLDDEEEDAADAPLDRWEEDDV